MKMDRFFSTLDIHVASMEAEVTAAIRKNIIMLVQKDASW